MTVRQYPLAGSSGDMRQYADLTAAEKEAWLHPAADSYHSFHVERMGTDVYRWRNSRTATYSIGTHVDLQVALFAMQTRKVDPEWKQYDTVTSTLTLLSQTEIDDLLSDL